MKRKIVKAKVGRNSYIPPDCKPMKPCMGFTPDSHINWGLVVNQLYRKSTKLIKLKEVREMCTRELNFNSIPVKMAASVDWNPKKQSYEACAKLILPTKNNRLLDELVNPEVEVFGIPLEPNWGSRYGESTRRAVLFEYFDSIQEAEEWLDNFWNVTIYKLKYVVEKNRERLSVQVEYEYETEV